jgi:hypothetical protein
MGRIGRSFRLVAQSYRILMQDKELMALPLVSGVVMIVVVAGLGFGFGLNPSTIRRVEPAMYLPLFVMYVVAYAIGIFFQAAVVAGATERLRGGDPTIASALSAAARRAVPILMWAVIAATVGVVIRMIHERLGFVGRIVTAFAGAAWSLATFFVVPVLVLEDRSVRESFTRSVRVFRQAWGETVVGGTTLGAASMCASLTLIAFAGLAAWVAGPVALGVLAVGAVCLSVFFSALHGIYVASLYRYATEGQVPPGLDRALLDRAFVTKPQRDR